MSLIRYVQKLQLLDKLISKKSTGNQASFCKKASMSRSLLNSYIKEMRELGFPIEYDKNRQTYYYKEEGRMTSHLFIHKLNNKEMNQVMGGSTFFDTEMLINELNRRGENPKSNYN